MNSEEGRLMDEGFPLPKYNVENHLKWMDEAGVETSVLTLAAPQPSSAEVVRLTNEAAARIKREHPDRFLFCAALPLPDVSKAIEEAKYALDVLKADGIKVPHCGAYLPLAIPRMKSLTPVMQANKMVGEIDYEANLRALYYDLAGAHSPEVPFREMILYQNANQIFK